VTSSGETAEKKTREEVSEEVETMLVRMRKEAEARDGDRAAIYVATVRPTMAGARFVRREQSPAVVGEVGDGKKKERRPAVHVIKENTTGTRPPWNRRSPIAR
jgi:hypothetical protein